MLFRLAGEFFARIFGNIPLRVFLGVPCALLVLAVAAATGWLLLRAGQDALDGLAGGLRGEISARVAGHVQSFTRRAHALNRVHAAAFALGHIAPERGAGLEKHFWKQLQDHAEVSATYFGNAGNGAFHGARQSSRQGLQISVAERKTRGRLFDYQAGPNGEKGRRTAGNSAYDARKQVWFESAVAAGRPVWSAIHHDPATHAPLLTASEPVYDAGRKLLGVAGSDLPLDGLSETLRGLELGEKAQTFIVERNGLLVASSAAAPLLDARDQRLKASASDIPLLRDAARHLEAALPDLYNAQTVRQADFSLDGVRQFAQVTPWRDAHGLDWLIAVVVPGAELGASLRGVPGYALAGAALAAALLAIGIGVLAARLAERSSARCKRMAEQLQASARASEQQAAERAQALSIADKRLRAALAHLAQSEKMALLGRTAGGMARELHAPLVAMQGDAETLRDLFGNVQALSAALGQLVAALAAGNSDAATLQAHLDSVADLAQTLQERHGFEDGAERLGHLLAGLARIRNQLAHLDAFSRQEQRPQATDIHACLDSALLLAKHVFEHKIEVVKHYTEIPRVTCVPAQVQQVFLSLFENAAGAVAGRGKLFIKTSADADYVHISVQDTGQGIPKARLSKLFDSLHAPRPASAGTGPGLFISYRIVRRHGGRIRVASQEGKGTRFLVSLPRHKAAE